MTFGSERRLLPQYDRELPLVIARSEGAVARVVVSSMYDFWECTRMTTTTGYIPCRVET